MSLSTTLGKSRRTYAAQVLSAAADIGATAGQVDIGPLRIYRFGLHMLSAKTTGAAWVIQLQACNGVTETVLATLTGPDTAAVGSNIVNSFEPPLVVPLGSYFKAEVTGAGVGGGQNAVAWWEATLEPLTRDWLVASTTAQTVS